MTDVIVVSYRTPVDLQAFCDSMRHQKISSLTVVNNDPREIDLRAAERISEDMGARVITNTENVGYANAVNEAALYGTAPVLAFFNADVIAPQGTVDAMTTFLENHQDVGIAGPKQVDGQNRITHGGVTGSNRRPILRGWHQRDYGQFDDPLLDVVSVSGSAYFVKRDCWTQLTTCSTYQQAVQELTGKQALGAFLPTRHYYEETFCSYHAREHGWKVAYNGLVSMVHHWRGSNKDSAQLATYASESRKMFRKACAAHDIEYD